MSPAWCNGGRLRDTPARCMRDVGVNGGTGLVQCIAMVNANKTPAWCMRDTGVNGCMGGNTVPETAVEISHIEVFVLWQRYLCVCVIFKYILGSKTPAFI